MEARDHSISKATLDPAADAAAMLLRLGFAIFAIVIPSATLMSRWVIVVLVPIGAVLIVLSAVLRGNPFRVLNDLARSVASVPGLTAVFLAVWAIASLAWAPGPDTGAVKIFKSIGVFLLGFLAVKSLPQKMRASNLHLVTIGVALGAVLILTALVGEALGWTILRLPAATPGRSAVLLVCLGWAGAAWLLIKNRRHLALGLVALVFLAAVLGPTGEAILPMGVGLLVFALAWAMPERAGNILAALAAALIVIAPLTAFFAGLMHGAAPRLAGSGMADVAQWWDVIRADPVGLFTGHGFDSAVSARDSGRLPPHLLATLVSDIWYDLGLLGALASALLVHHLFRITGRLGLEVAPLALAALASAFTYTLTERGATQTWWLNGLTVLAIVLVSVERGRYRTVRPRASVSAGRGPDSGSFHAATS